MKFQHPHALDKDEARRRVEKLLEYWRTHYGVNVHWNGDSARVNGTMKGFRFDAALTITEDEVQAQGTDPGLLLRAAATAYLKRKLAHYLNPAIRPEDLGQTA